MLKISSITRGFDREKFDCGSEPLNAFLKAFAFQSQAKSASRTYILHSEDTDNTILGFYTLVLCTVVSEQLPRPYSNKYKPSIPGINLARLAVDKKYQGKGFGAILLSNALKQILRVSEIAGAAACFVDAKEGARDFYINYGFTPLNSNPDRLFLPIKTIKELF